MKQIATLRMTQAASKVGENAPLAAVCCNACRTCVQTNVLGLALGGIAAFGSVVARRFRRM